MDRSLEAWKRVSRVSSGMPHPGMKVPKLTEVRKFLHRTEKLSYGQQLPHVIAREEELQ